MADRKKERRLRKRFEREKALGNAVQADALHREAEIQLLMSNLEGALDLIRRAVALNPESEPACGLLAHIYSEMKDWGKATEAAIALHRLEPGQPRTRALVIDGYLKMGRNDDAFVLFGEAALPLLYEKGKQTPADVVEDVHRLAKMMGMGKSWFPPVKSRPRGRVKAAGQDLGPLFEASGSGSGGLDVPNQRRAAGRGAKTPAAARPPDSPARGIPTRAEPAPEAAFSFRFEPGPALEAAVSRKTSNPEAFELRLMWERLLLLGEYDELLCLSDLRGVDRYSFQIGTVRRVLQQFRGRVLLADEVGLGKTIEAGMILKEYALRGLAKSMLVLAPAPLVSQWSEELSSKFGLDFDTTDSPVCRRDPAGFWAGNQIVASVQTARRQPHFDRITGRDWDIVVVDEAHALRNRASANWKLADAVKKRFLLLLTATPVQNDLDELYSLVTLLKPGAFRTPAEFKREFVNPEDPRRPANPDRLREILRSVMIRNTRAAADVSLPPRFASTCVVDEPAEHGAFYRRLEEYIRSNLSGAGSRMAAKVLLMEAGSSHEAVRASLAGMAEAGGGGAELASLVVESRGLGPSAKCAKLVEILEARRDARTVVFTQFLPTLTHVGKRLEKAGIPFAVFTGSMTNGEKDAAVERFRTGANVLLASESGGQGRNLQFASGIVNFDVPWNPMRIEQRIGRIHRIGQKQEVFVFNLASAGTVEEDLLRLLDEKIRMFELVVGEVGMILGNLPDDRDFAEIVMDLWAGSADGDSRKASFEKLGDALVRAKKDYVETSEADGALLGEEYEA